MTAVKEDLIQLTIIRLTGFLRASEKDALETGLKIFRIGE
jgi:hypothetical protein